MGCVPDDRPREPRLPSKRVEDGLRERLARGEWGSGERLPPVAGLAAHYSVARSTVISALRRIEADGLIEIVANWGTFRVLADRRSSDFHSENRPPLT